MTYPYIEELKSVLFYSARIKALSIIIFTNESIIPITGISRINEMFMVRAVPGSLYPEAG